jgi:hypothetical protein
MFDASWRKINVKKLIERYSNKAVSIRGYVEMLPLQRIWLTALVNICKREEYNLFKPLSAIDGKFSPTRELIQQIVNILYEIGIVGLSNHVSDEQEANFMEDLTITSKLGLYFKEADYVIDPYALFRHFPWKLTVDITPEQERLLYNPLPIDFHLSHRYIAWKTINAHEALELFRSNTDTAFSESLNSLLYLEDFDELLDRFSLSQLSMVIYFKTNQLLRNEKEGKGKGSSEKVMKGVIQYLKEKDEEQVKEFKNRQKECPQTALSKFVYSSILGIGEVAYLEAPSMQRLNKATH